MAFTSRSRGQIIQHSDVNQYGEYFAAANEQVVTRAADSAVSYADSVAQRDTTNGYIFRAGYGAAGTETWMLEVTKAGAEMTGAVTDKGGQYHNVLAYGAVADSSNDGLTGTNNTAAFAAALAAAIAGPCKRVYIPGGKYRLDYWWIHNASGVEIVSDGQDHAILIPSTAANGKHFVEIVGCNRLKIDGLGLGQPAFTASTYPRTMLFIGQDSLNQTNALDLAHMTVYGRCTVSTLYVYGVPSSSMRDCDFFSYSNSVPVESWNQTNSEVSYASGTGITLATGALAMGDWTIDACETHELAATLDADGVTLLTVAPTTSLAYGVLLNGVYDWRRRGGNIGVNGGRYIHMIGTNDHIVLDGIQFYAGDPAGVAPADGITTAASAVVNRLTMTGCSVTAVTRYVGLGSGATLNGPTLLGLSSANGAGGLTTNVVGMQAGIGTIKGGIIDCFNAVSGITPAGAGFDLGATGINSATLLQPGTVATLSEDYGVRLGDSYVAIPSFNNKPASTGSIRLATQQTIRSLSSGGSANVTLIGATVSDRVMVGATADVVGTILNGTTDHDFQIAGSSIAMVTSTGLAVTGVASATTSMSAGSTPATAGNFRLPNTGTIQFRNNANNNNIIAVTKDSSDNLTYGNSTLASGAFLTAANNTYMVVGATTRVHADGTGVGFNAATPIARPDYTITNPSTDRALNVSGDTTAQVAAVLGTLIQDLIDYGLLQ